jgi:nitroreductase
MSVINELNWRYAVKAFDPTKKISKEKIETLQEVLRLSASSYGLQPYKYLFIEDKQLREKLIKVSWNQSQIVDASNLIVFTFDRSGLTEEGVAKYIKTVAETRGQNPEDLKGYHDMINGTVANLDESSILGWQEKQLYIALGQLMSACASLGIDSCPMEGFDNAKYDEILGLDSKGLKSVVVLTVGYRAEKDHYQHLAKARMPLEDLVIEM